MTPRTTLFTPADRLQSSASQASPSQVPGSSCRNTGPADVTFDFGTGTEDDDVTVTTGVKRIGGTASLAIDGFVEISGSFGLEKQGDTVLVGVAGFTSFLGINGGTEDALGVQVSAGNLGLVLRNGSYALDASGAPASSGWPVWIFPEPSAFARISWGRLSPKPSGLRPETCWWTSTRPKKCSAWVAVL